LTSVKIEPQWEPPVLDLSIDADFYLRSCPSSATAPGVFMQDLVKLVTAKQHGVAERLYEAVGERRWIAFKTYPLRDFMRLAVNASRILYDSVPLSEGLRRLGRTAFPSLRATMAGRVVLFALGNHLEDAFRNAPRAYKLVLPQSEVTVEVGDQRGRIELRGVYNFPTAYHYGVFEGTIAEYGFQPRIRIIPTGRWCDASFDVEWH
jgi:uncharacterized protein (TIGR02265 family)